jgi:hypothetical protein
MKKLKYRVWNKKYNRFVYLDSIFNKLNDDLDYNKIQQYIEFKDINGIEIYEGDIVQLTLEGVKKSIEVVEWGYCGWNPYVNNNNPDYDTTSVEFSRVIGNIYENPELLKVDSV